MCRNHLYVIVSFLIMGVFFCSGIFAEQTVRSGGADAQQNIQKQEQAANLVVRLGEGGFRDSRSPEGKLGGGQVAFDIKPGASPIAFSISFENYTNSADPSHIYEIEQLVAFNVLYMGQFESMRKLKYFFGGGFGRLEIPGDEINLDNNINGTLVDFEAGVNYQVFRNVGLYGVMKYLRSEKSVNNENIIDFNEGIFLLGLSFSFNLEKVDQ